MPGGAWLPPAPTRTLPSVWGSSPLDCPVASCRSPGREQAVWVQLSIQSKAGKWLGCSHLGDPKCFWIHQHRQA